jgi:cytoskeletal protein RodZ
MKMPRKQHKDQRFNFYSEDYGFLGHLLYSERLLQKISLESVAVDLNLSSYIIKDLETGHLNRMPGQPYMLGFMRTYASYLGLDGIEMVQNVRIVKASMFEEETVLKVPFQQSHLPSKSVLWGSVCALILIIIGYSASKANSQLSPIYSVKLDTNLSSNNASPPDQHTEKLNTSIENFLNIYYKPFIK